MVTAEVSGFGDVTHRLVERHGPRREFLPGAIDDQPRRAAARTTKLLSEIDHVAVCVPAGELDADRRRSTRTSSASPQIFEEYIEVGGQGMDSKVVQSPSRRRHLHPDRAGPDRRPGQIDDFLSWHAGAGVQHVAFRTDDIVDRGRHARPTGASASSARRAATTTRWRSGSARSTSPVEDLRELGILVDRDHWGQLYQIFTQSMHVRRTLFLELIERHGALTFGSGNIKALYEAKERELAAAPSTAA